MKKFCCEEMKECWVSSCLIEIDEKDEECPSRVQDADEHIYPDKVHPVKKGEIYLYDEEWSQISGKPLRLCPWCGTKLDQV